MAQETLNSAHERAKAIVLFTRINLLSLCLEQLELFLEQQKLKMVDSTHALAISSTFGHLSSMERCCLLALLWHFEAEERLPPC